MPPKRACDTCISRKVKCSGSWPCDTCRSAVKQVRCTYLKPAHRRGPKSRRVISRREPAIPEIQSTGYPQNTQENAHAQNASRRLITRREPAIPEIQFTGYPQNTQENAHAQNASDEAVSSSAPACSPQCIPRTILASVIRLYQQYSYGVWPVVNAEAILVNLEDIHPERVDSNAGNTSCLIMALCAATMAQLHLDPFVDGSRTVDSTTMAQACLRMRASYDSHGANLDLRSVLVSFFLHVYHAKVNQRNSAMMFIQEAMAGARILRLNEEFPHEEDELIVSKALVFPLLWVSERGYSLHLNLSPSYIDPPELINLERDMNADFHAQGLLELVKLFIAFDQISIRRNSRPGVIMATHLTDTELKVASLCFSMANHVSTRSADYHITREWMRTILWQEALALGLLSSSPCTSVLAFGFPAQVGRALLQALRGFSDTDLLPLGRDQLLKCFEVANSLADTVILSPHKISSRLELGPQDFLHALYQKIAPFLEQDTMLKSIIRAKTAEALVAAPARLLTIGEEDAGLQLGGNGPGGQAQIFGYIPNSELDEQNELIPDLSDWLEQPICR